MLRKWKWPLLAGIAAILGSLLLIELVADGQGKLTPRATTTTPSGKPKTVREPAVAGLFYPKEEPALSKMIDGLLEAAPDHSLSDLKALVCPHAGYAYSGLTAATAYKTLPGRGIQTVVLLAPSHYASFKGVSVANAEAFRTPLGLMTISEKAAELAKRSPFVLESPCYVQRPQWWPQSSRPAPAVGEDTPHTWEHSAEVQVPFLQKVVKNAKLLPAVFGDADPALAAQALAPLLDDHTLVIASSDLSHYHPYEMAKTLDHRCVKAIEELDLELMNSQEACGKMPILTVMHLARQKGWKTRVLDYRNSGDTSGDKSGVVGYTAIAFYAASHESFSLPERKQLLELARNSLKAAVTKTRLPALEANTLPKKFTEPKGCFVTLTKQGALRGCIGHIFPQLPLYRAIMENAQSAALRDPRFRPVQTEEIAQLEIEISILTEPQPLNFSSPDDLLQKLKPHQDGVVLRLGDNSATYLPQVWAQIPDKSAFLNSLAQKAGCPPTAWRNPGAAVWIYHVENFQE